MSTYIKHSEDDSLTHYGVKGMKWRKRKGKQKDAADRFSRWQDNKLSKYSHSTISVNDTSAMKPYKTKGISYMRRGRKVTAELYRDPFNPDKKKRRGRRALPKYLNKNYKPNKKWKVDYYYM